MPLTITSRDIQIFRKLNAAGWLTTEQIRDYFFPGKSTNAVCKRLRKLACARYLAMARHGSTESALLRLSGQGRLALMEHSSLKDEDISIPSQLPRKITHFAAINDLRFCFERLIKNSGLQLLFFFSERELTLFNRKASINSDTFLSLLKTHGIIPDAIARVSVGNKEVRRVMNLAIEYDAGTEHASFFARTKIKQYSSLYEQGGRRIEDFKVLTFAPTIKRVASLMRQAIRREPPLRLFNFALINQLAQSGWETKEIFIDPDDFFLVLSQAGQTNVIDKEVSGSTIPKHALVSLPATSPRRLSLREERLDEDKDNY